MTSHIAHEWKPISGLPADAASLASSELRALERVWREQKQTLEDSGALKVFNQQLQRQWAIETGIIERIYTMDRGVTQTLIEQGIAAALIPSSATNKDPQLVAAVIRDHSDAVDGMFSFVKDERSLSTGYIKELHSALMRNQETCSAVDSLGRTRDVALIKGEYKKQPNNPTRADGGVHEYCPPEQVAHQMDQLVEFHERHEQSGVSPEVASAWLHHAFAEIHPFQDGNGRLARAIASLVFIKADWFPLTITNDDREKYLSALEAADRGELKTFVDFIASIQKNTFVKALTIAGKVQRREQVDSVIKAARDRLAKRREALSKEWERAKNTSGVLEKDARERFDQVKEKLEEEIGPVSDDFEVRIDQENDRGDRRHYFRQQVVTAAKELNYFANLSEYHSWIRLVLRSGDQAEVLVSFHGIGHEYRGLLAVAVCFSRREETEGGVRQLTDITPVSGELFQINYLEDVEPARERFQGWLERGLTRALDIWRQGL